MSALNPKSPNSAIWGPFWNPQPFRYCRNLKKDQHGSFRKLGVPYFGIPSIRILLLGYYFRVPYFRKLPHHSSGKLITTAYKGARNPILIAFAGNEPSSGLTPLFTSAQHNKDLSRSSHLSCTNVVLRLVHNYDKRSRDM